MKPLQLRFHYPQVGYLEAKPESLASLLYRGLQMRHFIIKYHHQFLKKLKQSHNSESHL